MPISAYLHIAKTIEKSTFSIFDYSTPLENISAIALAIALILNFTVF